MDVLNTSNVIDLSSIKNWQNTDKVMSTILTESNVDPIFKWSLEINEKIALWTGSVYKLKIDAIVVPINTFVDGKLSIESSTIYKLAGNKYARSFINTVIGCKTSEIRVTDGYDLPCYHVFHTVVPRFNSKYESAAINAIYNCYRNSLLTAMDMNVKKIGFATLHLSKHPFPDDIAVHITARTIRRFLEKYPDYVDTIVLQVSNDLLDLYNKILPIYFPRDKNEESYSILNMPDDLGNEDGQPILPDREIRISAFPYGPKSKSVSEDGSESDPDSIDEKHSDITSSSRRSLSQTHVAPAVLRQSLSVKSQGKIPEVIHNYEESLQLSRRFDRLLRNSRKMDMTNLTELRVFYQCGKDVRGQPILLVVERNIPTYIEKRRDEILSFIIGTMEKSVKGQQFSIIYAHTGSTYHPSRSFLTEVYEVLRPRYQKFLNCVCMVHPSIYDRGLNWIFTTFSAPDLKSKLFNVTNLRQLYRIVNPRVLELPDFIHQYDKLVGGSNKHNDYTDQSSSVEGQEVNKCSVPPVINEEL